MKTDDYREYVKPSPHKLYLNIKHPIKKKILATHLKGGILYYFVYVCAVCTLMQRGWIDT